MLMMGKGRGKNGREMKERGKLTSMDERCVRTIRRKKC